MKRTSPIVAALDAESHDWLAAQAPDLLGAVEAEMNRGADPDSIYRMVSQHVGAERQALAIRVRQAANHIQRTRRD